MKEINKRLLSSISLIGIFIIAYYSKIFLLVLLFFIFLEMMNEFYIIQNKIFKVNKVKLFITVFFTLNYLLFLVFLTWLALSEISNIYKIPFIFVISICIATDVGGFVIGKLFKGKKLTKLVQINLLRHVWIFHIFYYNWFVIF